MLRNRHDEDLLSVAETARLCHLSVTHIYRLSKPGQPLEAIRTHPTLISAERVDAWLKARKAKAGRHE